MLIEQVSPGKMEGVKVAPAVYSLETGQVAWLDWEKKLRSVACMSGADHAFLEEVFSKHRNHLADGPKLAAEAGAPRDSAEALMAA